MQFLGKRGHIREAAIQTLALQNTEFDFGHVQPTAMFGRVGNSSFLRMRRASAGGKVS